MPQTTRQLVAIMFTDIVGYTALMGEDEAKAFDLLEKNRNLQKPLIDSYGGKWIKELGDGVLATFSTVSDAVYCAAAIQQESKKEADLILRIGIHLGEVVFEGDDVFGDGVNIASRLESLAPSGGIWVSEAVSRNIQNKHGIQTLFVREEQLKNVKDPVKIYEIKAEDVELPELIDHTHETLATNSSSTNKAVYLTLAVIVITALSYWGYRQFYISPPADVEDITIAVLAFDDQSPDGDQEYLGDGVAGEIINLLGKVNGLNVIGKASSFSFKGKSTTIEKIGEVLNADVIVDGSVIVVDNITRIVVQLIDVPSSEQIWSNKYDRQDEGLLTIIDGSAQSITEALKIKLSIGELEEIKVDYEVNPEAYEYFLIGEHFNLNKFYLSRNDDDFIQSEKMYLKAISIDSTYAEAYAGLSGLYYQKIWDRDAKTMDKFDRKVDSVINIAYLIDPNSAYVLKSKGESFVKIDKRNIDSAFYYFKKARDLEPNNIIYSYQIVGTLWGIGLFESSISLSKRLLLSDPLNLPIRMYYARSLDALGKHKKAKEQLLKIIEVDPNNVFTIKYLLLYSLVYFEDLEQAKRLLNKLEQVNPNNNKNQEALILAFEGRKEESLNLYLGDEFIYSMLNMKVDALNRIDSLRNDPVYDTFYSYPSLQNDKVFDFLRDEPKFKEILAKVKIVHDERVAKYGHLFDE